MKELKQLIFYKFKTFYSIFEEIYKDFLLFENIIPAYNNEHNNINSCFPSNSLMFPMTCPSPNFTDFVIFIYFFILIAQEV